MKWNYNTFDWCFNTSEFSPQKPEMKHQTVQSLCKRQACRKTQLKVRIFVAFCDFRQVSLCGTWLSARVRGLVYSMILHIQMLRKEDISIGRQWMHLLRGLMLTNFPLYFVSCLFSISPKWVKEISSSNAKIVWLRFRPTLKLNGNTLRLQIFQFESNEHF